MSSDLAVILSTVEKFSTRRKFGSFLAETKIEKGLLLLAGATLLASVVLLFIERFRTAALVAGLIFLLTVIVLLLVQASMLVATFHTPLKGYAVKAEARLKERMSFISELAAFSPENLGLAKKTLSSDTDRMQRRLGILVGAVEKAGFIPAGLALYYAAVKAQSGVNELPANLLMAFVFGLYAGAFLGHRLIEALRFNIECLEEAHEMSLQREQFHRPNSASSRPATPPARPAA